MKTKLCVILVAMLLLAGCSLQDPAKYPDLPVDTVVAVGEDAKKAGGEWGNGLFANYYSTSFQADKGQTIYYELSYNEGEVRVRLESPAGNVVFSAPYAEQGIYAVTAEESGNYKLVTSYSIKDGGFTVYVGE